MKTAITLRFDPRLTAQISRLEDRLEQQGLLPPFSWTPYPPHIPVATFQRDPKAGHSLRSTLVGARQCRIRFTRLGWLPSRNPFLFLRAVSTVDLMNLHRRIIGAIQQDWPSRQLSMVYWDPLVKFPWRTETPISEMDTLADDMLPLTGRVVAVEVLQLDPFEVTSRFTLGTQ